MSTATAEKTTKATEKTANQSNVIALVKKDTVDIYSGWRYHIGTGGDINGKTADTRRGS